MFLNSDTAFYPQKKRRLNDDNLIPLINIVFLLLIFFMVAGQIEKQENIELTPPSTTSNSQAPMESINITIDHKSNVRIDGNSIGKLSSISADQWGRNLSDLNNTTSIFLEVDANILATTLDPLLSQLREHKISKIQLAVQTQ